MNNWISIVSWIISLCVSFIPMFFGSIVKACQAFDNGCLTGKIIFWTILKCICAPAVSWFTALAIAVIIYLCVSSQEDKYK